MGSRERARKGTTSEWGAKLGEYGVPKPREKKTVLGNRESSATSHVAESLDLVKSALFRQQGDPAKIKCSGVVRMG